MSSETREKRKKRLRQSIIDTAKNIARKEDWHAVTIRRVAEEIHYTPPVVYEHFRNKDDLLKNVINEGFEELKQKSFDAMAQHDDPEEKLLAMAEVRFNFATKNAWLHQMMFNIMNPEVMKQEALSSMDELRVEVLDCFRKLSPPGTDVDELFVNMISVIIGHTHLVHHLNHSNTIKKDLLKNGHSMRTIFINAFKRFLYSVKHQSI